MFLQFLTDFDGLFRQVNLIGEANQHGTFVREEGTCCFLALVVSEGVVVGEAEHFAKLSASLRPKGSLSLTQKGQAYARPNSHKRYLLAISMIYCIMEQIATHHASATICIRAIVN